MNKLILLLLTSLIVFNYYSCTDAKKIFYKEIDLGEAMVNPALQISGMDWHGEKLVLLSQIPKDFSLQLNYVFKDDISAYLKNDSSKIAIFKIHLDDKAVSEHLGNKNEYEAIAFKNDTVYMLIETDQKINNALNMESWIVRGRINFGDTLSLDATTLKKIPLPNKNINEMACEAITIIGDSVYVFYEANGANLNKPAQCFRLDLQLNEITKLEMDHIEYRITDATKADKNDKFWVINNLYKGDLDSLLPANDNFIPNVTGSANNEIKRIVRLQAKDGRVRIADKNTIMLEPGNWNWEGLVQFDKNSFLIINDTYAPGRRWTCLVYIKTEVE